MSEIRSVSVHLDADVADYIAKMKLAGAATDQAFGSSSRNIDGLNRGLSTTETELNKTDTAARRADTSVRRLNTTVRSGSNDWTRYASKVDGFTSRLITLPGLALGATAALQPLAVAGAGVAAAFAAPIAFGGGGLTLFAILGGFALRQTNTQLQKIDQLQTRLKTLKVGTAEYTTAQQQLKVAQDALTPAQKEYSDSLDHLHASFNRLLGGKSGATLLGPISDSLDLAANVLPKLQPILKGTSDGLEVLLGDLSDFSKTKDFRDFVHEVGSEIGPDLVQGGRALGSFAHGVGDLLLAAGQNKNAVGILREVGHLGNDFQSWAGSKRGTDAVEGFFSYVHQIGPDVATTVGDIADAAGQLSQALKPIGPVELQVVGGIASAIADIPVPVLTALTGSLIAMGTFQKVGGIKVLGALGGITLGKRGGTLAGTGGPLSTVLGSAGVQKVYVVNMPPGGPGRRGVPTTTPTTSPSDRAPVGGGAPTLGLVLGGTTALGAVAAGSQGLVNKLYGGFVGNIFQGLQQSLGLGVPFHPKAVSQEGKILSAALSGNWDQVTALLNQKGDFGLSPAGPGSAVKSTVAGAAKSLFAPIAEGPSFVKGHTAADLAGPQINASTKALEKYNASLSRASQAEELVGHSADRAFNGDAAKGIQNATAKISALKNAHGEQAFDVIGHSAAANSTRAVGSLNSVTGAVNRIPGSKNVNVKANVGQALGGIRAVVNGLLGIHDKTVTVRTVSLHNTPGIVAPKHAVGGYISGPGSPTSDSIPAYLSNGEYVVRAAAVRHWGVGTFDAMNARGYADGGPVTTSNSNGDPALAAQSRGVRAELSHLKHSLHDANTELDKQVSQLQNLRQAEQQLAQTVAGNFRTDLFGQTSTWAAANDPLAIVKTDIRNARRFRQLDARLRRRGLTGGALAEVTTLADAQQLRGYSNRQLRELSQEFQVRQRLSRSAGQQVATDRYGNAIAQQTAAVEAQRRDVHQLTVQQHHANHRLDQIEKHTRENADKTSKALNTGAARVIRGKRP